MPPATRKRPRTRRLSAGSRKRAVKWLLNDLNLGSCSGRKFAEYKEIFGGMGLIEKGKKVLDLGAGKSDFAAGARKNGIEAFAIDARAHDKAWLKEHPEKSMPYLTAAIAQELPFPNDCFDTVVSYYGALDKSRRRSLAHAYVEALRVVKPGGRLAIYPPLFHENSPGYISYDLERTGFGVRRGNDCTPTVITKPDAAALKKLKRLWKIK